jgi:hypothetical protein
MHAFESDQTATLEKEEKKTSVDAVCLNKRKEEKMLVSPMQKQCNLTTSTS